MAAQSDNRGMVRLVREVHHDLEKSQKPGKDTFSRHKSMSQLGKRVVAAYEATVDKLFKELLRYISKEIVGAKISKAHGFIEEVSFPDDELVGFASDARGQVIAKKMSLLTPTQLDHIKDLIRDYHAAFAIGMFGPDVVPSHKLQRLIASGILPEDLNYIFQGSADDAAPMAMRITDLAYQYGMHLANPTQEKAVVNLGIDRFLDHLEKTRPQLTEVEQQAMAFARYNGGEHVQGMGDRLAIEVGTVIRNADAAQRRRYMGTIARELEANIDKRQEWRKLASEIGHATEDWSRDMQRLAATEKQFAMQEGKARAMAKGRDPDELRVYKRPNPDACADCTRLHLTAGPGSAPRIFTMSELMENGTNVGRKRQDWRATVGPVHPWCGCEIGEVPEGFGFDDEGDLVPEIMLQKGDRIDHLAKGDMMTFGDSVPEQGLVVQVADPVKREVVEQVLSEAPAEIFHKDVGITLITTDIPRVQNPLDEHDLAYWTANEIRLSQTLAVDRIPRVLRHELGHTLNVFLFHKLGSTEAVRAWHDRLWEVSQEEGFVSEYATKLPIENAAEVTRMYLFERARLMLHHPQQFAFVHRDYREIFEKGAR